MDMLIENFELLETESDRQQRYNDIFSIIQVFNLKNRSFNDISDAVRKELAKEAIKPRRKRN